MRRVQVLGEVTKPGVYLADPTVSLAGLVALAGGATPGGDLHRIRVVRAGQDDREQHLRRKSAARRRRTLERSGVRRPARVDRAKRRVRRVRAHLDGEHSRRADSTLGPSADGERGGDVEHVASRDEVAVEVDRRNQRDAPLDVAREASTSARSA